MSYSDDPDFLEKRNFVEDVMVAIENAGYPNPGYFVAPTGGQPYLCDASGAPRVLLSGSSPTAILISLGQLLEVDA